jgi:hypothetical protein
MIGQFHRRYGIAVICDKFSNGVSDIGIQGRFHPPLPCVARAKRGKTGKQQ